ncbi:importin subunit alpha-6 [Anaeramoeba flamelloides]|uniref:Importin subunit alpha-6 n=1 Tax=Anaeramoeba flamelloides TaxID=1746091 RepID=A0ABQ8X7E1_9EUKA|nr:importin subunit alpha-6 [Anaeramoeba flamelloides]
MEVIQAGVWVLLNVCSSITESNKFDIIILLRILSALLSSSNEKVFQDTCFGIQKLAHSSKMVSYLFEEETISILLATVKEQDLSSQMRHYLLLTLEQIIKISTHDQLLLLIKLQILQNLHNLYLFHYDPIFCETLIKIIVLLCKKGTVFIEKILHSELITILLLTLKEKKAILTYGIKFQLLKLFNLWYTKTELINALWISKQGAIFFLRLSLLKNDQIDILHLALNCVLNIIAYNNQKLINLLENNGIFPLIEKNIQHPNKIIQSLTIKIMNKMENNQQNFERNDELKLNTMDIF